MGRCRAAIEPSIVDAVATSLRYEGFDVDEAATGRPALAAAQANTPDMNVLDVMLVDLFLTARYTVEDKVAGLTVGATTTSPNPSRWPRW
jgi:two-component system OmpR family response regulator